MDRTTEALSSYACSLGYKDLGPQVVHQVKRILADTLGCALGGYPSQPAIIARAVAGGISSSAPSRILGTGDHSSPDMAAFANGVMIRYLDCNDSYFSPGGGHPSDMIPAALSLAAPTGSGGRSLITAIVLAYEVFCRLSDEVVSGDQGWDQGMFSVIGAACAAGKMLGLDRQRMGHAISLAVTPNLPLGVTRTGELSMWKGCAAASATKAGIFAAQLAAKGMTGPFEPFEGRRGLWAQALGNPPETPPLPKLGNVDSDCPTGFRIMETTFKSFPSQIHTQAPIEMALEIRSRVSSGDIASIRIHTYGGAISSAATEPEKWDPKTRETADHSIPYLVAAALQDGDVTEYSFADTRILDPALRSIMAKMTLVEDPEFTANYPSEFNCRMEVTDLSGQVHEASTRNPKGNRRNPMSDAEVEAKFHRLAAGVLPAPQRNRVLELVWSLEELPALDPLFESMVIPEA